MVSRANVHKECLVLIVVLVSVSNCLWLLRTLINVLEKVALFLSFCVPSIGPFNVALPPSFYAQPLLRTPVRMKKCLEVDFKIWKI